MSTLKHALEQLMQALPPPPDEDELPPLPEVPLPTALLTPASIALIEQLKAKVKADVCAYLPECIIKEGGEEEGEEPLPSQADDGREEAKTTHVQAAVDATHAASSAAVAAAVTSVLGTVPITEESRQPAEFGAVTEDETEEAADEAQQEGLQVSELHKFIAKRFNVFQPVKLPGNLELDDLVAQKMTSAELVLYHRLAQQAALLGDPDHPLIVPASVLQKIRQALSSIAQRKIPEAHRILKSARQLDPRNAALAFFISQMAYYRTLQGSQEFLPEAREEGFRSAGTSEQMPEDVVFYYRYLQVVSERALSPAKAVELMREHYLLSPDTLTGPEGLTGRQGIPLKALILLSDINLSLWTRFEYECLNDMVHKSAGGLLLYIALFRQKFQGQKSEQNMFAERVEVEQKLTRMYQIYMAIQQAYDHHFNPNTGLPRKGGNMAWCVGVRYLQTVLMVNDFPTFDEVLWHISLDGRRVLVDAYPGAKLVSAGISHSRYWQIWNVALRPDASERRERLPCVDIGRLGRALALAGRVLEEITMAENMQIDLSKWQAAEPYIGSISYGQLCNAGSGKPVPENLRGPRDPFLKTCYRTWLPDPAVAKRPSEVIHKVASAGAFSDIYEAADALIGAANLLEDPVHGLKQRIDAALKARQAEESDTPIGSNVFQDHVNEFWWFYFLVLPTSVLTFFTIVATGSYTAGLKVLLILAGLFAVGGYMAYRMSAARKKNKTEP